ncbi:MAG: hypothetical protein U5K72_14510 [Balneolaceae bacterium]|nr:hypothetical protein [Balneolaceae bacterium]
MRREKMERKLAYEFIDTQNNNIELLRKDKKYINIQVESFENDFVNFWKFIGAEGDIENAREELKIKYHESIDLKTKKNTNNKRNFKKITSKN